MKTLMQMFPNLTFAHQADEFLTKWKDNPDVVSQLRERRIHKVKFQPLFSSGGLGLQSDGSFFVALNNIFYSEELALSLGHEIGHTFHHDLSTTPPTHNISEIPHEQLEDFCDAFAELWLAQQSVQEVARRIKNSRRLLWQF